MTKSISERLAALREVMKREHLAAFIFPSTDPHCGEYVPAHWKGREYISGFNGSAGTAVVTLHEAALWTDSRYFIAAEEALRDTEYVLMKEKIEGTPTIAQWIARMVLRADLESRSIGSTQSCLSTEVGIDGMVCSAAEVMSLKEELRDYGGLTLRTNFDPLSQIWHDRPPLPAEPIVIHPIKYAGETCPSKICRVRAAMRELHVEGMLVSTLDDIAWVLNLRGNDVPCTPVFLAYLLITNDDVTLYVDQDQLNDEVRNYLSACGVRVGDYTKVKEALQSYDGYNILIDPSATCCTLYKAAKRVESTSSPIPVLKAVKNETEIAGFRSAMVRDGVAMVRFLHWLDESMSSGEMVTELTASRKLYDFRAEQALFKGISFDTISAYGAHGAIVHYEPTPDSDIPLEPRGFLLVDSGGQYLDGTTDITRTIPLGPLTDVERLVYTLVLKAHIALERLVFPDGATGTQLDAVAREPLWREGLNYLHGTGHGVGSFLNVHEGPHQIRMEWKPARLHAGMIVTDEPGIYLAGRFGVRIENTLLIVSADVPSSLTPEFKFLTFESLTHCPIDLRPVIPSLLTREEIDWLNTYHERVRKALSPHLDMEDIAWLEAATTFVAAP